MNGKNGMTRRTALALGGFAGFTILPSRVLGQGGAVPPSEKLNLAFVGIGARGSLNLTELNNLQQNVVALCDVDWRHREVTGRGGPDPNRLGGAARNSPITIAETYSKARRYDDFRKMLDAEDKNIDAVVISTPDHLHAPIALAAMKRRKHVYVEKNMCRTIEEARRMIEFEKKYKVTVQTGNQGHSTEDMRRVVEWFRAGAIGDVKTVHLFRKETASSPTAAVPGGLPVNYENVPKIVAQEHPTPDQLLWDLWLGPAPVRGFNPAYHPNRWRAWLDFGTGNPGDLLNHMIDAPFWALNLDYPTQVESNPEEGYDWKTNKQTYPWAGVIRWVFPARGKMPPVEVFYHYGQYKESIPRPPGWKEGEDKAGNIGGIMFGSKGAMTFGALFASDPREASTGAPQNVTWGTKQRIQLWPQELDKEFKRPDPTLPRPYNHWADWVASAKAGKPAASGTAYGGKMSEIALAGNGANAEPGKVLEYDVKAGRFKNSEEANKMVAKRSYRPGWELPT